MNGLSEAGISTPITIDTTAVAHSLGLSKRTIESLVARDAIPHMRIGRRVLFPVALLNKWIEDRTRGGAE